MNTRASTTPLRIVIFGLSITSSWGNGHATTFRALIRALSQRGHRVSFYERERRWYADNRDLADPGYCSITLYDSLTALDAVEDLIDADVVMIGSYVPDGIRLAESVLTRTRAITVFYDLDTPVTLARLKRDDCSYLTPALVSAFDLYLSFAGGPILHQLERQFGANRARPLYCGVDCDDYYPEAVSRRFDLGYLGTYSTDRQPKLEALLNEPARRWSAGRFCVAGAQYPSDIDWPANVDRVEHLPPREHRRFYNEQRFTLNVTREDMVLNGWSPSVRLFEAGACGVPIISDEWRGLEDFFTPGEEILIAQSAADTLHYLKDISPADAFAIGERARARVLAQHTSEHRARELEGYIAEIASERRSQAMRLRAASAHASNRAVQ
jgi:spore maturation protein CgeB